MNIYKYLFAILILSFCSVSAQKSAIYTNDLVEYNHAVDLYQSKDYVAAQIYFKKIKNQFDNSSELKARCNYYEAFCAIRLGQKDADELMKDFFENYPTSTKRNDAYLEVGDYYFEQGKYAYALKWFQRVNNSNLSSYNKEDFTFKNAYALFAVGSYAKSKTFFSSLLNSEKYGAQAKYYYGYMAYSNNEYDDADKYLSQVSNEKAFDDEIPYYLTNIKFKTGKFQEAIDSGIPILKKSNGIQKSELSKIIGESYFNLGDYENAISYLLVYEGKKGKFDNTDYYQLGYAYYQQEDYQNAMLWFTKIIDGNNAVSQNAYYHLGICYLKEDKKQEALNAFRNAKQMDFDMAIKKDSWLNYAKLSYDIGNPYKSSAEVIQEYLAAYPDTASNSDINELLISAFISSDNYEGAMQYLSENKDAKNSETYQKVAYLYGIQLFKKENYTDAITNFNLSLNTTPDPKYKAKATFWKAESNYRMGNFKEAEKGFQNFIDQPDAKQTEENTFVNYNLAYTYFKLKDYSKSGGYFNEYINNNPSNEKQLVDSYVRLGDCFFALSNYYKAIMPYQKVVDLNVSDIDYAQLQLAMCYGFSGEIDKKIDALQEFTTYNLKSPLRDDAFYELGNSFVRKNQNEKALEAYDEVITNYKMSSFVPKSLLKQGLVYYNSDENEKALSKYKTVVQNYPGTTEAKEAITNAKQIYIDLGRVDEYEKLVKNSDFINITDLEVDNTMYASAEKFYLTNQTKKAIEGFEKYLKRFPKGENTLASNFYLAESYRSDNQNDKSVLNYTFVANTEKSEFKERSLVQLSLYYLKNEDWDKASNYLTKLEQEADEPQNILFAQSNLMKSYYAQKNYIKAEQYAEVVLKNEKLDAKVKSDAEIIIARSAFETGDLNKAQDAFKKVEGYATGEVKAEAIYFDAYFKHEEGNYKLSNVSVQKLASELSSHKYWGGKGLIIMAKNYYALEDAYQATYILESVIQNFSDYKDVVDEAKTALNKIKSEQAKTNSSVIIEKKP